MNIRTPKEKAKLIFHELDKLFPEAKIMLYYSNPFELLVAVILSAQCTDKMVNKVTPSLFRRYRTVSDYADADSREIERLIYRTGFYRMKAKHIIESARIISEKFQGKVPNNMSDILTLPGVGRKTANVVLGNAYDVVEGIAVDTHVGRLARTLGLSKHKDPVKVERDLMTLLPQDKWLKFTYLLIEYGRAYCTARKHDHAHCPLTVLLSRKIN